MTSITAGHGSGHHTVRGVEHNRNKPVSLIQGANSEEGAMSVAEQAAVTQGTAIMMLIILACVVVFCTK